MGENPTLLEDGAFDRQRLFDAAGKLEDACLVDAAAVAGRAAEQLGDKTPELIADILADPIRGDANARLASLNRRGEIDLEALAQAGAGADVIEYVSEAIKPRQYLR